MTDNVEHSDAERNAEERAKRTSAAPFITAFVTLFTLIVIGLVLNQRTMYLPVSEGTKAFDFDLPNLEGDRVDFSNFYGKVVFLNFWATWCEPCEAEMPSMEELYTVFKSQGKPFEIVAVSIDTDKTDVVQRFVDKHNLTFTVLHDMDGKVRDMYKTTGVPETYIIDQNGYIVEKILGERDWTKLDSISSVTEVLQKGPLDPSIYAERKPGAAGRQVKEVDYGGNVGTY